MHRRRRKLILLLIIVAVFAGRFFFPDTYARAWNKIETFCSDFASTMGHKIETFRGSDLKEDLKETGRDGAEVLKEIGDTTKENATELYEKGKEAAGDIKDQVKDKYGEWKDRDKDEDSDDDDESSLSDEPEPTAKNENLIKAKLTKVVDGDTVWVDVDENPLKVRLLLINAEESVHSDASRNNEYGKAASDWLKDYLNGVEDVWLEYDVSPQDMYGRELCYLWTKEVADTSNREDMEKYMVNAVLLSKGYVYVAVYKPNVKNEAVFREIQKEARDRGRGLWQYQEFQDIVDSKK